MAITRRGKCEKYHIIVPELNALKGCLDIKKNKLCIAKSGFEKMLKSNNFRRNSFIERKKFSEVKHFIN